MKWITPPALVLAVFASGCTPEAASARADTQSARAELLQTDREWAALVASRGPVDEILGYWTDDARLFPPGEEPIVGKDALREMVASSFEIPGFSITWEPDHVEVGASGDLGYTTGWNTMTVPGDEGGVVTLRNRYITVWRKEADGRWRCEYDMWNPPPTDQASAASRP